MFDGDTVPSVSGNAYEGVTTRIYGLRRVKALYAHEIRTA